MSANSKGEACATVPDVHIFGCGFVSLTSNGGATFQRVDDMSSVHRRGVRKYEEKLKKLGMLARDEMIEGVYEESGLEDEIDQLMDEMTKEVAKTVNNVTIRSQGLYMEIAEFSKKMELRQEAQVYTKYKTVSKKVKPVATQLPDDSLEKIRSAATEPMLREARKIGHQFTEETLKELKIGEGEFLTELERGKFQAMLAKHGKAFAFSAKEIGCVDPFEVPPMVIFTIPHVPWNLRPIPVPRALLPKLMDLLKEKVRMGILEPSIAPYSSRWFTVTKKSGALRFIQDMQPANRVTIRNMGSGPIVDEVAEAFAGCAIYSSGDLFSGYDQFQLAHESRDLTTMKTPLGLVRMCTLP